MKTEVIQFNDFMSGNYGKETDAFQVMVQHFEENKYLYGSLGLATCLALFGVVDVSLAAEVGIDEKANQLYQDKFLLFAKWIIIGKGGFDTINKTLKEDFEGAKKSFIQYTLVFVFLMAYPWVMEQVEDVFNSV